MFSYDQFARVAAAAVGALVLSTLSVAAAVGPGHTVSPDQAAYAQVRTDVAHG